MRFKFLYDFRPRQKCGAAVGIGVGTAVSGLFGSLVASETSDRNQRINIKENEKQRQFSHDEAELAREWSATEWQRQYDQQREEWYRQLQAQQQAQWDMYQKQAEYNSPKEQVKRLNAAGLNASAVMNGTASSGLISAATANQPANVSPSVPTGGQVSAPAASAPSPLNVGIAESPLSRFSLGELGSFLASVADANQKNMLTPTMRDEIEQNIQLLAQKTFNQELLNDYQKMQNAITQMTLPATVNSAFYRMTRELIGISLDAKLGKKYDSESALNSVTSFLREAEKKLTDKQFEYVALQVDNFLPTLKAQFSLWKSQEANNYGQASLANANAETVNAMREFVVQNAEEVARLNKYLRMEEGVNAYALLKNQDKFVESFVSSLERNKIISKEEKIRFEKLELEGQWYWLKMMIGYLGAAKDAVNPMGQSSAPIGGILEEGRMMQQNAPILYTPRPVVRGFAP